MVNTSKGKFRIDASTTAELKTNPQGRVNLEIHSKGDSMGTTRSFSTERVTGEKNTGGTPPDLEDVPLDEKAGISKKQIMEKEDEIERIVKKENDDAE